MNPRATEAEKNARAHQICHALLSEMERGAPWAIHAVLEGKRENLTGRPPRMSLDTLFEQYPKVGEALETIRAAYQGGQDNGRPA